MTSKKSDYNSITVECEELEHIYNFDKEEESWEGKYADTENKIPYVREKPVVQTRWENFMAKCIDLPTGRWFTSGEGTGRCLGKEGPRPIVTDILRLKLVNGAEYLLSNSRILEYNQSGDL